MGQSHSNFNRNYSKKDSKSMFGLTRAQQVVDFGFSQIPDFKVVKYERQVESKMKVLIKQATKDSRQQINATDPLAVASLLKEKPLFIASTKKNQGLQRECS